MSQKNFNTDWLNERYNYDNAARNPEVERVFLESINGTEVLNIVDIGSGTGSNFLYFTEKFPHDQNWILIEQDQALCQAAFERIKTTFSGELESLEEAGNHLKFQSGNKSISVKIVCDSFYNIAEIVDLQSVDAVLAAAVFDVLSKAQFEKLMNLLIGNELFLMSTMNYSGMQLYPEGPGDQRYVDLYEKHMLRPQDFGTAMGKNCPFEIETYFNKRKLFFQKGKSLWNLDPKARKMQSFMLGFMEKSISEMLHLDSERILLQNWVSEKRKLSHMEKLSIEVTHFDFLLTY